MEEVICWESKEEDATGKLQFPELKYLRIDGDSLVCFCRGANEIEFHQLETLDLSSIPAVGCITSSVPNDNSLNSIFPHKVFFPSLVEMDLRKLDNMKSIWCGQLQSSESFLNLSELNIDGCESLEYVFSPYMATYLVHLHTLWIDDCPSLKEIVNGPLMMGSLLKLKKLMVSHCDQMRNIFRLSAAVDTVDLEELTIDGCGSMEEVISWEGRPEEDVATSKLSFPKLHFLSITDASSLICFCKGAMEIEFHQLENPLKSVFPDKVFFPSLVEMELRKLKNMKEIWCVQLQSGSFLNLSTLEIDGCNNLEYLFRPCTAKYLVHLRKLNIWNCNNLKEVISAKKEVDGIEDYTMSILPKLKDVQLSKLLALERFYHVANEIEFPELDNVAVVDCPVFKFFSPVFVHTPILSHVKLYQEYSFKVEEKVTMWKGDLNSTIQHLHKIQQIQQQDAEEVEKEEEGLSA